MAAEHIRALEEFRNLTVEQRRKVVMSLATPHDRSEAQDLRGMFLRVQATIEAIDRALKDEQGAGSSVMAAANR